MATPLVLSRAQVLAHRRRVGALDDRLPAGVSSTRVAAWAGLTDSVPRAALLSLHARVEGTGPYAWQDEGLVQLWGPRFSAYVVAEEDRGVFTLGRMPTQGPRRRLGTELADRLEAVLAGGEAPYGEAARAMGEGHNQLRYAAPTGRVLIRWDGARQPLIRTVPAPAISAAEARLELARRYLHVLGPGTVEGFGDWAGVRTPAATATFEALAAELVAVRTPVGDAVVLAADVDALRAPADPRTPAEPAGSGGSTGRATRARLLPSGDAWTLAWGRDRELLVPDPARRAQLWTSRVWPGAVLVDGELVGTWRRSEEKVTVTPWEPLSDAARQAVEDEAAALPLPGLRVAVRVRWEV